VRSRMDIFVHSLSDWTFLSDLEWTFLSTLSLNFLEFFTVRIKPCGALVTLIYSCFSKTSNQRLTVFSLTPNWEANSLSLRGLFPSTMPHVTPSRSTSLVVELTHQRNNQMADPIFL